MCETPATLKFQKKLEDKNGKVKTSIWEADSTVRGKLFINITLKREKSGLEFMAQEANRSC